MRLLILVLLVLISSEVSSQKDIIWSDLNLSKSTFYESVYLDGYIYMVKVDKNGFSYSKKNNTSFHKYNSEMKEEEMSFYKLKFASKKITFQKLLLINKQLYFLSIQGNGAKDKRLVLNNIDKNKLEIIGKGNELVKIEKESILNNGKFLITQSPDKNLTLITAQQDDKGSKKSKKFQFLLFNEDLELILDEVMEIKESKKKFKHTQSKVDNTGNIFMMAFESNSKSKVRLPKVYLWRYLWETKKKIVDEIVSEEEKYIKSIDLELSGDDLVLGGLYSEKLKSKKKLVRGLVFKSISKLSEEKITLDYVPFPGSTLHHTFSESKQKRLKAKKEAKEYGFLETKKVLNWNDEHIVIVGEQIEEKSYKESKEVGPGPEDSYTEVNNLIVSCLNKKGDLIWSVPIEKSHQIDTWFNHHSFMISGEKEKVHVFYNKKGSGSSKKGMVMTSIDLAGKKKSKLIFSKGKDKILACPTFCQKMESNTYFIYGRNWLKDKFGILTLSN